YARLLQEQSVVSQEDVDAIQHQAFKVLEDAKREADASLQPFEQEESIGLNGQYDEPEQPSIVPAQTLIEFNAELLSWPERFSPNSKLARLLQRRATTMGFEGGIDWGQAEALAFASILAD